MGPGRIKMGRGRLNMGTSRLGLTEAWIDSARHGPEPTQLDFGLDRLDSTGPWPTQLCLDLANSIWYLADST